MKLHHRLANWLGYELRLKKTSHISLELHLAKLLNTHHIERVLDVGANVGQFALSLRKMGFTGEIVSFEPTSECLKQLHIESETDNRWRIEPFGLGQEAGEFTINIPNHSDFASLHDFTDYSAERFPDYVANIKQETISVKTLSNWLIEEQLTSADLQKTLLKIDTQGHDMPVMLGAGQAIQDFGAITTELSFIPIYEGSSNHLDVLSYMKQQGYQISGIYPISRDKVSLSLIEADCVAVNTKLTNSKH